MEFEKDSNAAMPFRWYFYPFFFQLLLTETLHLWNYTGLESLIIFSCLRTTYVVCRARCKWEGRATWWNYCEFQNGDSSSWNQAEAPSKPGPCDCIGGVPMKLALFLILAHFSDFSSRGLFILLHRTFLKLCPQLTSCSACMSSLATSVILQASTVTKTATNLCYTYLWMFPDKIRILELLRLVKS